jgi:hypothetical protein
MVVMRRTKRFRSKRALVVAVVACACAIAAVGAAVRTHGSSGGGASSSPAANAASWQQSIAQIGRRYAQCLREHGHPQIADPSITTDGRLSFGAQEEAVDAASRALRGGTCLRELMALKEAPPKPPTAAELHQAVLFARCVRRHGLADWPDPHPDGTYPLSPRLRRAPKGQLVSSLSACQHFNPGGRIQVSRAT